MISDELVVKLREQCSLWRDNVLPDSMLEAFVLKALHDIDASEYEIDEVFSEDVVSLLLEHGAQQFQCEGAGGVKMISAGREVDISYLATGYRRLFERWSRRGWIESTDGKFVRCAR